MYSAPKKNSRGYEAFSLKEGRPDNNTRIGMLVNESLK